MKNNQTLTGIPGFRAGSAACGLKSDGGLDVAVIASSSPCRAAAVFTRNLVQAAPILLCKRQLRRSGGRCQAIVVNSGNANACTGERGERDAWSMASHTARVLDIDPLHILVASTGIIGQPLPIKKVLGGIEAAAADLGDSEEHGQRAAQAIMTTDKCRKIAAQRLRRRKDQPASSVAGMAKGAGMICPKMATMLGFLATDAPAKSPTLKRILRSAVAESFNRATVDGHTSTNDMVAILSSGKVPRGATEDPAPLASAVTRVCRDLAEAMVADGEGATKVTRIRVLGAASDLAADRVARTVAGSPLVRTALYGNDPNWGRIVSAVGYCTAVRTVKGMTCKINGTLVYRDGTPAKFDAAALSKSMKSPRNEIEIKLRDGQWSGEVLTSDLTHEYVTINAEYHT